jgi:hypothetical protein
MTSTMTAAVSSELVQANFFAKGDAEDTAPAFEEFSRKDGSVYWRYTDIPVFRSGVFANSAGVEREWDALQMNQMVNHHGLLNTSGTFKDVPVRVGHPSMGIFGGGDDPMKNVIGYVTSLRTEDRKAPDGGEYTYLLATYDILDEDAQKKIQNRLYRNRSAEIGTYFTNSPVSEYWPVLMGFAYVDIPAVEHLNGFSKNDAVSCFGYMEVPKMTTPAGEKTPAAPAAPHQFTLAGKSTSDYAAVQLYIAELEGDRAAFNRLREEVRTSEREGFVSSLVEDGKILATQKDSMTEFAKGLGDEQFAAFTKMYEGAGKMALFEEHGGQDGGRRDPEVEEPGTVERETISAWTKTGAMKPEQIRKTPTYARLKTIDPSFEI